MAGPSLVNALNPKPTPAPQDFSLSSSQTRLTFGQGSAATSVVTVKSINGFNNVTGLTIKMSATVAGLTSSLDRSIVTPPTNGNVNATLAVAATYATPNGNYVVTITGTSGAKSHSVQVPIAILVSPAFSVSANPSVVNVARGGVNTTKITVTSLYGFSGTVAMTFTAPFALIGVAAGVTPLSVSGGGSNTTIVAISATNATAVGTYDVNITATSGTISRSATVVANVTSTIVSGGTEALTLETYAWNSGTNVTLGLRSWGTVSVHLVAYYVTDASGDQYSLTSWNGPTIAVNAIAQTNIVIGSSCAGCTLAGSAFTFTPGNNYYITLVTARNTQFRFTLAR